MRSAEKGDRGQKRDLGEGVRKRERGRERRRD